VNSTLRVLPPVASALADGQPVVALESSVLAQGLPIPANRKAAELMVGAVESQGATAAVTAVVGGIPTAGLTDDEMVRFLKRDGVAKVSARDLAPAMARGGDGATTVAATLLIARLAGIQVFATGGIGGVHRSASPDRLSPVDESADLAELAHTPVVVVCAGAKSILDLPATWERLETLGITVIGYRTDELPGFFAAETGIRLANRADSAGEIAAVFRAERALGRPGALLVVQAPPEGHRLPGHVVDAAVERALGLASAEGVSGAAVTPYLLAAVERETGGRSLQANLALLESNARLAGEIAVALVGH
jgi:pseudouridine-5'-phosphate glycosidase